MTHEVPRTGVAAIDALLDAVTESGAAPLAHRVAAFTEAHERLRSALDDLDALDDVDAAG